MTLRALYAIWTSVAPGMANHLWQSTVFTIVVGLLALALRKNQARTRYWLWMTASLKFLIPFSLLISIGSYLPKPASPPPAQLGMYSAIEEVGQPFAQQEAPLILPLAPTATPSIPVHLLPALLVAVWLSVVIVILLVWSVSWMRISKVMREAVPILEGCELEALRGLESVVGVHRRIKLRLSHNSMEPGIFGIYRPVLIWPEGISQHLEGRHIEAILAHEVCHVRRRDNLTAVLHMLVEAIFWFHPLVWWLGARLEEERERACDEEVVRLGGEPQIYAESILKVVEFYLASPVPCAAGVTGGELKKRIESILRLDFPRNLSYMQRALLALTGILALAVPLVVGLGSASAQQQSPAAPASARFEVASVKPAKPPVSGAPRKSAARSPGRAYYAQVSLSSLLAEAYGVEPDRVVGPGWMSGEYYSVAATMPPKSTQAQYRTMLQNLLAERFAVSLHHEERQYSAYQLTVAPGGPKLQKSEGEFVVPEGDPIAQIQHPLPTDKDGFIILPPGLHHVATMGNPAVHCSFTFESMADFADFLRLPLIPLADGDASEKPRLVDRTGLTGAYDFHLLFARTMPAAQAGSPTPANEMPAAADPGGAPDLFTALEKQLGLKLSRGGKVTLDMIVVDEALRTPTEN